MFRRISRNNYDAARCASSLSRASSDFAESFGMQRCDGHDRLGARVAFAVAGMAHHARQPPRDGVRRLQVGLGKGDDDRAVFQNRAEIHLPHQPADDARAVELGAGVGGIESEACDRQAAAAFLGLIDGAREIALEGCRRQQAGAGVDQALGVDRFQRAAQMRLEGVLADQRQRGRDHLRGFAGEYFEVRQFVGRRQVARRHHDRQVAEAGVLRQHGEEGVDHARTKPFAEHDAVDVAGVEMLGGGLDAECADHAVLARRATLTA